MMNGKFALMAGWLVTGSVFLASCSQGGSSPTSTTVKAEKSFCSTTTTYSGPTVTISGTAKFNRRVIFDDSGTATLGSANLNHSTAPALQKPIRLAEVIVTDASGRVAQCTSTNDLGEFNFTLPKNSGSYLVSVNSRAYSNLLKVSVLNNPTDNQYYSVTGSVQSSADSSDLALVAAADGEVLGGAFNILDQIDEANRYLRTHNSNCTSSFPGCFDVNTSQSIPKVQAYWTKGFNPGEYFDVYSGLSYYIPGDFQLFILGGINGNLNSSDTDHFDDSVILHEYGHFLEDAVGTSDSPGGPHDGASTIDPRLAWSEGWGNFFQAAVRGQANYIDTQGNIDGSGGSFFDVDLETLGAGGYGDFTVQGESNFLEFAVTRMLWDAIDNNNDSETMTNSFPEIWAAFTSYESGFGRTTSPTSSSSAATFAFRNMSLLNLVQQKYYSSGKSTKDWSSIRTLNGFNGTGTLYGTPLVTTGCSSQPYSLSSLSYDFQLTPELTNSDEYFRNNDYYYFKAPSSGRYTIQLQYVKNGQREPNLDIFIYQEDHELNDVGSMLGYSARTLSQTDHNTESVTATLNAGAKYLIQVRATPLNTGMPGSQAYYNLYLEGGRLCPSSLVP